MKYVVEFEGDDFEGIGDFEADTGGDIAEAAIKYVREQSPSWIGEINWFVYADTGDIDNDYKSKLAQGNLFLNF